MISTGTGLSMVLAAALAGMACGDDGSGDTEADAGTEADSGMVDTSGACGVICEGGEQRCVIEGFDPADGLEACTLECQAEWESEQDCSGAASFVIECVDANGSCTTLENETCGDFPSSALGMLLDCIEGQ